MGGPTFLNDGYSFLMGEPFFVTSFADEGVIHICQCHEPPGYGNRFHREGPSDNLNRPIFHDGCRRSPVQLPGSSPLYLSLHWHWQWHALSMVVWVFICSNSSAVNFPGFKRIWSGMATLSDVMQWRGFIQKSDYFPVLKSA